MRGLIAAVGVAGLLIAGCGSQGDRSEPAAKPGVLGCPGLAVNEIAEIDADAMGPDDPIEATSEDSRIQETDRLQVVRSREKATAEDSSEPTIKSATVAVIRDGRTIALIGVFEAPKGGLVPSEWSYCEGEFG